MTGTPKRRAETHEPTPIVTFYSYKGGVGRSMAVLNVASLIASRGFRVLIIDFDLEAPGLSHLIGKEAIPEKGKSARKSPSKQILKPGIVELLTDAVLRGPESDLLSKPFPKIAKKYTFSYSPPEGLKQHSGAKLSIMPAGRLDEEYSARLDQLDLPGLYKEPESSGKRLILRFREILIHSGLYDYILVDSRTGHSDEAGICTRDLADHRMIVSGLNTQNITGTAAFLRNLRSALLHENNKKLLKTPDIILSPVPNGEDEMVSEREKKARHEFQVAWQDPKLQINLLIPYHPRLALTEEAYVPAITASPLRNAYLEIEGRVLRSLGHSPGPLEEEFRKCVKAGEGPTALRIIRRLIRLLRTPQFPGQLPVRVGFQWRLSYEEDFLKQIIQLDEALDILKMYAESTSGRFETTAVGKKLHELQPELAARFDQFILKMDQLHPDELGNYANFLTDVREDQKAAEEFYKQAIKADPKHVTSLGNYALFLEKRGEETNAEAFYKRAIEADPKHAHSLGNYALFLEKRGEETNAEAFYKRAIEADPKRANILGNYASFLHTVRRDHDAAQAFYKRAIEGDPEHANSIGNYANLLTHFLEDHDTAEAHYKRALDLDSNSTTKLGNYGQFLIGRGRNEEGLKHLRAAWECRDGADISDNAELAYSLWLCTLLAEKEEETMERVFKYCINVGFKRPIWNFDDMLAEAEKKLESADFNYAKSLAEAFLDEGKVPDLENFERWKQLHPLDPAHVNADGTIRKG